MLQALEIQVIKIFLGIDYYSAESCAEAGDTTVRVGEDVSLWDVSCIIDPGLTEQNE